MPWPVPLAPRGKWLSVRCANKACMPTLPLHPKREIITERKHPQWVLAPSSTYGQPPSWQVEPPIHHPQTWPQIASPSQSCFSPGKRGKLWDKSVQTPEKTSPSALPRPPMPPSEPRATENRRCPDQVSSLQACSFPRLYPIPESPDSSGTVGSQRQGRVEWALKQQTPRWLYITNLFPKNSQRNTQK